MTGYVPVEFGFGVAVAIPKDSRTACCHDYRCISISPIISKKFELCISDNLQKYLYSSDHQLGFKQKSSCAHAIYLVRKTVEYYVSNDSTVKICTLDISKAFDKLNNHSLLLKLMKRRLPINFIVIFQRWFCNVFIKVRWGNYLSKLVRLFSGVRQGGILSPVFFRIYIDDVIDRISDLDMGCFLRGFFCGIWLYADDIVLLSATVSGLQHMINACVKELDYLDMSVNILKTRCMRVGRRFKSIGTCVVINGSPVVDWCDELCYIGMVFKSSTVFMCNLHENKAIFSELLIVY